ncbi:MAG TPA: N-acetylmuramoyl-L-alanine amidase [Candidatus Sulfotelmatobacter sp.]|nr:N-acetylmuramoyl-L-alanine amidase [Candidatus Sulfotelmatobacter sp.]
MTRLQPAYCRSFPRRVLATAAIAAALVVWQAAPARADKKADARDQFERAVKLRTWLENQPPKERTLGDYRQTIAAYQKVYLIAPNSEEVTAALIAEGELYQEMGRQFDAKYYSLAIEKYNFFLKQYPGSRYRSQALFTIAIIQFRDLHKPDDAEAAFKEFLQHYPRSGRAADARAALKEIADSREKTIDDESGAKGDLAEPREADKRSSNVTEIRTWNAENYTRIVVTLDDTIKYDSARIKAPDRIYFDLYKAKLAPALAKKTVTLDDGLLKSVRLAQNKQGVVRLVLDVSGAKDYSAFLLANPYRLVIDVHAEPVTTAKHAAPAVPDASAAAKTEAENANPKPAAKSGAAAAEKTDPKSAAKPAESVKVTADNRNSASASKTSAKPAASKAKADTTKSAALEPPKEPKPTRDGQRSLSRALGLKISRIVIDPGHGGHDTGTIGPHGLMEKDLCLDVAQRLGRLIEDKLPGAEVIYTRKDDTFVPLEDRTAIANQASADLFISIHANSSRDHAARGVETYYLNFSTSEESMEVAARENARSQESMHDLEEIIKKIARNEKIEESKELASDIQESLTQRLQLASHSQKDRGVKKAPFIVLIGANMPSVLSEISFVSNPNDERLLRKGDQRQRIADGLYRGIANYLESLNSLSYNKSKLVSDNQPSPVASDGNPK